MLNKIIVFIVFISFTLFGQETRRNNTKKLDDIDKTTILVKHKKNVKNLNDIDKFHKQQGKKVTKFKNLTNWSIVHLDKTNHNDNERIINNYKKSVLFEKVEFNKTYHINNTLPNDILYSQLWGHHKIQAEKAWDIKTSNNVIVAVIDTGIDFNHEDIKDNLWTGSLGEHGYTAFGNVINPGGQDDHFHGTHVAGTIGAVGNNNLGIAGLNLAN